VVVMFASILLFVVLPWLDRSPVKSIRYKGVIFKWALAIFAVTFVVLGYLGVVASTHMVLGIVEASILAPIFTIIYFLFFLLMPWYSKLDKTKPVPERVTS
jgi:ubiquinol-cytochrome c reductase cytochrome b subunit